ncbi:hypothetical protein RJ641_034417 [Dillenia turbinata]|uniref:Metallothionein n=1 Tax=Dillenia turbinata TaxID=194707 RepID=A0AAN8ZDY8_9MAGN
MRTTTIACAPLKHNGAHQSSSMLAQHRLALAHHLHAIPTPFFSLTMSSTCGDCDCTSKDQCVLLKCLMTMGKVELLETTCKRIVYLQKPSDTLWIEQATLSCKSFPRRKEAAMESSSLRKKGTLHLGNSVSTDNIKISSSSVHLYMACRCQLSSQGYLTTWFHLLLPSKDNNHFADTVVAEVLAAEHDGKCKCGASCACTNCTCGH